MAVNCCWIPDNNLRDATVMVVCSEIPRDVGEELSQEETITLGVFSACGPDSLCGQEVRGWPQEWEMGDPFLLSSVMSCQ